MTLPPLADDLLPGLLALAGQPGDGDRARSAIRLLSAITLAAIVTIIGVGLVAMMLIRRHRRKLAQQEVARQARNRPPPDPWFESARRVPDPPGGPKSRIIPLPGADQPESRRRRPDQSGGADDDTVDLDPDELHERDVEGDDDDAPPETPPPPADPPGPAGPGSRGG
jgi:hypothetical protein